jgi:hypothetical protein
MEFDGELELLPPMGLQLFSTKIAFKNIRNPDFLSFFFLLYCYPLAAHGNKPRM